MHGDELARGRHLLVGEQRDKRIEILDHVGVGLSPLDAGLHLHRRLVAGAKAERETTPGCLIDRSRLGRKGVGERGLHRHDRRAQFDVGDLTPDDAKVTIGSALLVWFAPVAMDSGTSRLALATALISVGESNQLTPRPNCSERPGRVPEERRYIRSSSSRFLASNSVPSTP